MCGVCCQVLAVSLAAVSELSLRMWWVKYKSKQKTQPEGYGWNTAFFKKEVDLQQKLT